MPLALPEVHQGLLYNAVRKLFPGVNIPTNTRKATSIKNPQTGSYQELDIWVPDYNIGFEFQDVYHYTTTWYSPVPLGEVQKADNIHFKIREGKEKQVNHKGHTLLIVPCWWDGLPDSLAASIQFVRPDLIHHVTSEPIKLNPPLGFFKPPQVPDVGELMLASYPIDGKLHISSSHPWWLGEKYDGVRCCWNPDTQLLSGAVLYLLSSMSDRLPNNTFIDGELWFGRGQFSEAQQLVAGSDDVDWSFYRVVAFDAPQQQLEFESRYTYLIQTIQEGGEGIILRSPNSFYENGRSSSLVKLKASFEDQEALVTCVFENNDLELKLVVIVPSESVELSTKPRQGDIVSFFFNNTSRKVDSNMYVYRIRADISWEEVLASAHRSQLVTLNDSSKGVALNKSNYNPYYNLAQISSYWKNVNNRREWFKTFAHQRGFDPYVAENWYSITIDLTQEVKSILWHYSGKVEQALLHLFPEIGLKEHMFSKANFWLHTQNRANFFVDFAHRTGFDPLIPENWYNIQQSDVIAHVGGTAVLNYYSGSHKRALIHLFPQIGLEESLFANTSKNHWASISNRRKFFEDYAQESSFDPLVASNWYSTIQPSLLAKKGGRGLLRLYPGHSFKLALYHLFPELHLDFKAFVRITIKENHWASVSNRKAFFEQLAADHAFDPLVPTHWYPISSQLVHQTKGGKSVLKYYNGSYRRALMQLFPSIGLEEKKFISNRYA